MCWSVCSVNYVIILVIPRLFWLQQQVEFILSHEGLCSIWTHFLIALWEQGIASRAPRGDASPSRNLCWHEHLQGLHTFAFPIGETLNVFFMSESPCWRIPVQIKAICSPWPTPTLSTYMWPPSPWHHLQHPSAAHAWTVNTYIHVKLLSFLSFLSLYSFLLVSLTHFHTLYWQCALGSLCHHDSLFPLMEWAASTQLISSTQHVCVCLFLLGCGGKPFLGFKPPMVWF